MNIEKIKTIIKIKPYYETNNGVLYNADCKEILPMFEENTFDLTLTDPPYGINLEYDNYDDNEKNLDSLINWIMPLLLKISKRIALTPGINNIKKYPKSDWMLIWVYKGGANYSKWGFNCFQPILVYGPDPYLEKRMGCVSDVIAYEETPPKCILHPCPKPINFWTKLLKRCSVDESDVILDCFIGSGTTALSCERLKRKWVGIEISEKYCKEIKERLECEIRQGHFF